MNHRAGVSLHLSTCRHTTAVCRGENLDDFFSPLDKKSMKVCDTWSIPYLSLDGVDPKEIGQLVKDMEPKPRVILCTISTIADEAVQKQIGRLPIKTVCLDEVQVYTSKNKSNK